MRRLTVSSSFLSVSTRQSAIMRTLSGAAWSCDFRAFRSYKQMVRNIDALQCDYDMPYLAHCRDNSMLQRIKAYQCCVTLNGALIQAPTLTSCSWGRSSGSQSAKFIAPIAAIRRGAVTKMCTLCGPARLGSPAAHSHSCSVTLHT